MSPGSSSGASAPPKPAIATAGGRRAASWRRAAPRARGPMPEPHDRRRPAAPRRAARAPRGAIGREQQQSAHAEHLRERSLAHRALASAIARGGMARAHRALHRRRPAGVGPRAGERQAVDRRCAGRAAARGRPGAARNVAACSRVTTKRSTRAAARGRQQLARARARSARGAPRRSRRSRRRRPTATPPGTDRGRAPRTRCGRTRTAPASRRAAANSCSSTRPVVDDVQVDDRRAPEPRERVGVAHAPSAAGRGALVGDGERRPRRPRAARRRPHDVEAAPSARRSRSARQPRRTSTPASRERAQRGVAVDALKRRAGVADVAGVGALEQPDPEHERGRRQRRVVGAQVEGRAADQVPQRARSRAALWPCSREPVAEAARRRRAGSSGSTRPSASAARAAREPLARASGGGSAAASRPGAAARAAPTRRSQAASAAGREHRDREPVLERRVSPALPRRSSSAR